MLSKIPEPVQLDELVHGLLLSFLSIFILLNILFVLLQYVLLKRRTKQERAQNEAQKLELGGLMSRRKDDLVFLIEYFDRKLWA